MKRKDQKKNRAPAVCDSASALPLHWGVKKRRKMMKCFRSESILSIPRNCEKCVKKLCSFLNFFINFA